MKKAILFLTVVFAPALLEAEDNIDFATQIQPILMEHCAKCHGERADKGGLRLHTPAAIRDYDAEYLLGGGDPEASEVLARITLPADDSMMMPKGGDPLPEETIALFRKWIEQGGIMPEGGGAPTKKPEDKLPDVPPAPTEAIEKLTAAGAQVLPLFQDSPLLRVTFAYAEQKAGDQQVALLADAAPQVVWLNLAQSKITNAGTAPLATLENLSHLHLELTEVGDDALMHLAGLKNLEYLNLYGTQVTDAGLEHIKGLTKLKKLYLWQTPVTFEAAMALQESIEGLEVNLGWNHPKVAQRRVSEELERVKARVEDAANREELARMEKEAATERQGQLEKELKELTGESKQESSAEGEKAADDANAQSGESKPEKEKPENKKSKKEKSDKEKAEKEEPAEEKPAEEKADKQPSAQTKADDEKPAKEQSDDESSAAEKSDEE